MRERRGAMKSASAFSPAIVAHVVSERAGFANHHVTMRKKFR